MSECIDPFRHWSFFVFVLIAVCSGVLLLPICSRVGGWSLDGRSFKSMINIGLILGGLIVIELMIWKEILDFINDRRK